MLFNDLLAENRIVHATCMIPRRCFDDVGLFDETLTSSEDIDMSLKLARKYPFRFVPEVLYYYRMYEGNTENRLSRRRRYANAAKTMDKHFMSARKSLDKPTKEKAARRLFSNVVASRNYGRL